MHDVSAVRQSLSERNLEVCGARFEREALIPESRRPAIFGNGHDNEREVEVVFGAVGQLNHAIHTVAAHPRRTKPFEHQARRNFRLKLFADSILGRVFHRYREGNAPRLRCSPRQEALRHKRDPLRQVARCHTPPVRRNAAASVQRNMDFHASVERRQSVLHNDQR